MLDMGFGPQLRRLLQTSDANEDSDLQVLMFSATYPPEISELASEFLDENYVRLNIGRIGSTHKHIG
jgi:ATP-dependent RNA helicase DDX3X